MSDWYYTSIFLRKDSGKIKVDVCTIPSEKNGNSFKSLVAKEYFELSFHSFFKRWMKYERNKGDIFFQVISQEKEFSLAEKENLSFAMKYLSWKLFFLPKYKKALKAKIEKIH